MEDNYLRIVERSDWIVKQKSSVHPEVFRMFNIRPSSWVKIHFRELEEGKTGFVIVFLSSNLIENSNKTDICYSTSDVTMHGSSINNGCIYKIEPLSPTLNDPIVYVNYKLSDQFFNRSNKKITREYLTHFTRTILSEYIMTSQCIITGRYLRMQGILSIEVFTSPQLPLNEYFTVGEQFTCSVKNVNIISNALYDQPSVKVMFDFFEYIKKELKELFTISKQVKDGKINIPMPLHGLLTGSSNSGKSIILTEFLKSHNCNNFIIGAAKLLGQYPGETEINIRRFFQNILQFQRCIQPNEPVWIVIEDLHLICPSVEELSLEENGMSTRICSQLISLMDCSLNDANITFIATTKSMQSINKNLLRCFYRIMTVLPPTYEQRKIIFDAFYKKSAMFHKSNKDLSVELIDYLCKNSNAYFIKDIERILQVIERSYIRNNYSDNWVEKIKHLVCVSKPSVEINNRIFVSRPNELFSSMGGMNKLKHLLSLSVLSALKNPEVFNRFGLKAPKGVLLYGPPGCGKTSIVKCLATESNMALITVTSADIYSPYVGCAERYITEIFNTARKVAPCIIFFDEIDSLIGRRTINVNMGTSQVQLRVLSAMLTEMDGIVQLGGNTSILSDKCSNKNVIIVIGATNRPNNVDDALLRAGRFDKLIHVPPPDKESRRSLLQLYAKRIPFAADIDYERYVESTKNFSCADIKNLCNEAGLNAFRRNVESSETEVTNEDFVNALRSVRSTITYDQMKQHFVFEQHTFK